MSGTTIIWLSTYRRKYDVQGIPTFIIINSEGKIVKKLLGFTETRIDEMKDIVSGKK